MLATNAGLISLLKTNSYLNLHYSFRFFKIIKNECYITLGFFLYNWDSFNKSGCNFQLSGEPHRTRGHFNLIQSIIFKGIRLNLKTNFDLFFCARFSENLAGVGDSQLFPLNNSGCNFLSNHINKITLV